MNERSYIIHKEWEKENREYMGFKPLKISVRSLPCLRKLSRSTEREEAMRGAVERVGFGVAYPI
jgi:hypothetical protein